MSQVKTERYYSVTTQKQIIQHQQQLSQCRLCQNMVPPVIIGQPVVSEILLIGQAPGIKEGDLKRPFAWTAGKTLFKWFDCIGLNEDMFRRQVYMSAVCRCFPGKNPTGGDRVPNQKEIDNCSRWLGGEVELLKPKLILPVGKLAITQYLDASKLVDVVGKLHRIELNGVMTDMIPLPHPSGASTWHRMSPGKELLDDALKLLENHPSWKKLDKY